MPRVYTDAERLIEAARLGNRGHHRQAARIYHEMGNEVRRPADKRALWKAAERSRRIADSD